MDSDCSAIRVWQRLGSVDTRVGVVLSWQASAGCFSGYIYESQYHIVYPTKSSQ